MVEGSCGLITLGILKRIEELIADRTRLKLVRIFRTISPAPALERSLQLVFRRRHDDFGAYRLLHVMRKTNVRALLGSLKRIKYFYTADPLKAKLQEVFGAETTLEPASQPSNESVKCLLLRPPSLKKCHDRFTVADQQ